MTEIIMEVYEAFRAGGTPDREAKDAAQAISVTVSRTSKEAKEEQAEFKGDMRHDFSKLYRKIDTLEAKMNLLETRMNAVDVKIGRIEVMMGITMIAVIVPFIQDLLK